MVVRNLIPISQKSTFELLNLERHLLQKHYAFLKVKISGTNLVVEGTCQPTEHSIIYQYRIGYTPGKQPKVYITEPEIAYNSEIHMYGDKRLCLYYPGDFSFTENSHLFNTVIPWTHEWFVFYELFQITGRWHHPFVDHKAI
jgi:hypothetical protein